MPGPAYERDFYAWARTQAQALRHLARLRPNLPVELDLENLAEEVEALARAEHRAAERALEQVMEHLLLLAFSPGRDARAAWEEVIDRARAELEERLSPSLRRELEPQLAEMYAHARALAALVLRDRHEDEAAAVLPETCPWSLDQLLDERFWPENRWEPVG